MAAASLPSPRVQQAVHVIQEFEAQEREQLLSLFPKLLCISPEDYGGLKLENSTFRFWNNEVDAIYHQL